MTRATVPSIDSPSGHLAKLSDDELVFQTQLLSRQERRATLNIVLHLIEIDERRAYLARGYTSLFDYCTRGLGYSESAAGRRIRAARCVRDVPGVYRLMVERRLTLSTVSMIAGVLNRGNLCVLLPEVCDKSRREVEVVLSRYRPRRALRDRVTPVCVQRAASVRFAEWWQAMWDGSPDGKRRWQEIYRRRGGEYDASAMVEQCFKIEFAARPAFMQKLEEVKALLSTRSPAELGLEAVFETLMDAYIDRHSPRKRAERRARRRSSKPKASPGRSRHIPAAVRDAVHLRDRGRCTFVSETGVPCGSRRGLEIDHIVPYARGGPAALDNLRLLCGWHNRLEAERAFGRAHMRRFYRRE